MVYSFRFFGINKDPIQSVFSFGGPILKLRIFYIISSKAGIFMPKNVIISGY